MEFPWNLNQGCSMAFAATIKDEISPKEILERLDQKFI